MIAVDFGQGSTFGGGHVVHVVVQEPIVEDQPVGHLPELVEPGMLEGGVTIELDPEHRMI